MGPKEERAKLLGEAQKIVRDAKEAGRDLTAEEIADVETKTARIGELDATTARQAKSAALVAAVGGMAPDEVHQPPTAAAKSLGEHFVKSVGDRLAAIKGVPGASVVSPEWTKAATDTHTTGGAGGSLGALLTEVDRTLVTGYRRRLYIADLLGAGTLSGQAITYFVEGALEGAPGWVAEAATKPQMHQANPTPVTESLKEVAGWARFSDNMMDDLDFLVSEINARLLYELALAEETALLSGTGTGNALLGITERSIQTVTSAAAADNADAVFRALTAVSTGSGLEADGIVINPADYQALRLSKDANGQYFGGGFFAGQYGQGGITAEPPLWGRQTVVTPAIAAGTVLVGAFAQAATVYRKGGVRVEWTNAHDVDFVNDRVTVRVKERLALAVRRPLGFVEVALSDA